MLPKVSIVIPAYNETKRLPHTLRITADYFQKTLPGQFEIIVADDGSHDGTKELVKKDFPDVRVVALPVNRGKGGAVRTGAAAATGELSLVIDADGATPIEQEKKLREKISEGFPIAIGSRAAGTGKRNFVLVNSDETPLSLEENTRTVRRHRHVFGRVFAFLVTTLLGLELQDTQCGFKMFQTAVGKEILSHCKVDGFFYDVEFLYEAKLAGVKVAEVPVAWQEQAGSKVNVLRDAPRMFWGLLKLWLRIKFTN